LHGFLENCLDPAMDDHGAERAAREQLVAVLRRWLRASAAAGKVADPVLRPRIWDIMDL